MLWFYCVLRSRGCQRTLSIRVTEQAGGLTVKVVGYNDSGRGVLVAGATVDAGSVTALTGSDGRARLAAERQLPGARGEEGAGALVQRAGPGAVVRWLAALVSALVLAGCGLGEGSEREGGAELRVTRDFGHERLGTARLDKIGEADTVMRLLRRSFDVRTRYGGRFVQAIEGAVGKGAVGRVDWFYFVNGFEASVGAAEYELSPGDVVHWDYRSWKGAMRVPAIVGAFPEAVPPRAGGQALPGAGGVLG